MSTSTTDLNIIKFSLKTDLNTNPQVPEINKLTAENINEILNFINGNLFPVGTIIFNDNSDFDPNIEYGGTWELIKGKMIIGFDASDEDFNELGKIGGSKTHIQTIDELAQHSHRLYRQAYYGSGSNAGPWTDGVLDTSGGTENAGSNKPMNIMNPHYVANIWHRIA